MESDIIILDTLNDGSKLLKMPVSRLLKIPIWQGNRIINHDHVSMLAKSINNNIKLLDFGYRVVKFKDKDAGGKEIIIRQLVDGQHRHQVIKNNYDDIANWIPGMPEFNVFVLEKDVKSELEIIEYFNQINTVKPISWTDRNLVINAYIAEIESEFNKPKMDLIRKGMTRRPYLSTDRLRQVLILHQDSLKTNVAAIKEFIVRIKEWNKKQIAVAEVRLASMEKGKESNLIEQCIEKKFILGLDLKLGWIAELL